MKCVIKEHRTKGPPVTDIDRRIARITNTEIRITRRIRYENMETGEQFLCLGGGFAWPGVKPGFAVVLGVQEREGGHVYRAIAEAEAQDVRSLLQGTSALFLRYGKNCQEIPWMWYGDHTSGLTGLLHKFNEGLPIEDRFYLAMPPHHEDQNAFATYCQTILSVLQGQEKRLYLDSCDGLRSHLSTLDAEKAAKGNPGECPAIAALGYVLSAFYQYEPWRQSVDVIQYPGDSYEEFAVREQQITLRWLGWGDENSIDIGARENGFVDDGAVIPTVK
jgi:hypothetical protein